MIIHQNLILGIILCGGRNSRMGGQPKWQLTVNNKPMMQHIVERLEPQVGSIALNGHHAELHSCHYPVVEDNIKDFQGPLAGILAGLEYAKEHGYEWVASCPCDTPFLPDDLVGRFISQLGGSLSSLSGGQLSDLSLDMLGDIPPLCVIARCQQRLQNVLGLWHVSMSIKIKHHLQHSQNRSLHGFFQYLDHFYIADFDDENAHAFFNVNSPQDLHQAQKMALSRCKTP